VAQALMPVLVMHTRFVGRGFSRDIHSADEGGFSP